MRRLKGSIVKVGKDRWRLFATVRDLEGNPHRLTQTVSGTRADAERILATMTGDDAAHPSATVGQMLDGYLLHAEARERAGEMAGSTLHGYRAKVERWIRPELGRLRCIDLTSSRINAFLDGLECDRSGVWRVLRLVVRWGIRNGYMASDALSRVEPVKSPPPKVRREDIYTAQECAALLSHPMEGKVKTAVVLALSCGLRRGEICGLTWDDYDGETVEIRRAWGKDRPKTEASESALIVPTWARDYLDRRRGGGSDPIVGLEPDSLTRAWHRLWFHDSGRPMPDAPPVKYIPLKNLRHTSLSLVYESTRDIKAASRRGRHSSVSITERFYVRPGRSTDQLSADALDGFGWSAGDGSHELARPGKEKEPGQKPENGL